MAATPPPQGGLGGGGSGGQKVSSALLNFNAGELAPSMEGRIDTPKYNAGCYKCENFIPMVQGPARRRSGTRYIAATKLSSNRGWLTPFRFNITQSYVLEWGDYSLRFYTNRGQVIGPNAPIWTATTTVDGAVTWTNRGYPRWASGSAYALHAVILDRNGQIQWCTTAGTSGANYPSFTTMGATNPDGTTVPPAVTIVDGSVIWTCISVPQWQPNHIYNLHDVIYTIAGIMEVTAGGGSSGPGVVYTPYEIPTPYSVASLTDAQGCFALDFVESFDVIYFTHESEMYPPYKLERLGGTNWRFVLPIFQGGPFQPANPNDTIAVFASAVTGNVTLYASANIFPPSVIGSQFYLEQQDIRNVTAWEPGKGIIKGDLRRYLFVTYKAIQVGGAGDTGSVPPTHTQGSAWDGSGNGNVLWEYQDPGYGSVQITAVGSPAGSGGSTWAITGATATNPVVITAPGHTFSNGDLMFISGVQGMTDINNNWYVVASAVAGSTFHIIDSTSKPINGGAFAPYSGGGTASSLYWTAIANVIAQLPASVVDSDNSTSIWAFGAWSTAKGYPKCVKFFEDRLFFGSDGYLWGSCAADYENFNAKDPSGNVTAAQAISIIVPSKESLQWLVGGQALAVGTSGGELAAGAINDTEPLGPANTACKAQLTWGSKRIQAIQIGVDIYYVQTAGRKVRAFEFSFVQDQYQSSDVTVLADHIALAVNPTNPAINNFIAMAYQEEPDSVLWCLRADGVLCGYSLNKEQDVTGWHRQVMGGEGMVESICTIPSPDGTVNDLWMIVNRTINGSTARYVEYLTPAFDYSSTLSSAFFVDAGLTYNGPPETTFILPHLTGMTVDVLADGADAGQFVVSPAGTITLPRPASVIAVGLPMPALVAKMRLEAGSPFGAQYATQQGQTKRITNLTLRLLNTVGGFYGSWDNYNVNGITALDPIQFRDPTMLMDTAIPLFTGDTGDSPFNFPAGYEREARIMVLADRPLPMTVVGMFPQFESQERD